ncbi:hypothetical protein F2Y52_24160 [Bacteroides caccae]|nr:hypothetical protein F2Y52_24160 [Bacteroides caccae]
METNGTILPDEELLHHIGQFNVSPKLPHSGNDAARAWKPNILRRLAETEKAWFKFVASCEEDVAGVLRLAQQAGIPAERILIMPLAASREELDIMRPRVVAWCLRYGLRFSDRLHIAIWGSKKGV